MANKDSRSGGKFGGNHTTLTPLAAMVCDFADSCTHVTNISPGYLKAGLPSVNGQRRVKFTDTEGGLLLSIRDNVSHQEVRVYASNVQAARTFIARKVRDAGLRIAFGNQT